MWSALKPPPLPAALLCLRRVLHCLPTMTCFFRHRWPQASGCSWIPSVSSRCPSPALGPRAAPAQQGSATPPGAGKCQDVCLSCVSSAERGRRMQPRLSALPLPPLLPLLGAVRPDPVAACSSLSGSSAVLGSPTPLGPPPPPPRPPGLRPQAEHSPTQDRPQTHTTAFRGRTALHKRTASSMHSLNPTRKQAHTYHDTPQTYSGPRRPSPPPLTSHRHSSAQAQSHPRSHTPTLNNRIQT